MGDIMGRLHTLRSPQQPSARMALTPRVNAHAVKAPVEPLTPLCLQLSNLCPKQSL
jgi:hypothetical protein